MNNPAIPYWPRAMRLVTAAAYVDLSTAEFLREVKNGVLPFAFRLGRSDHWDRWHIDKFVDRLTGVADDWRVGSALCADASFPPAAPKTAPAPKPASGAYPYSVATLAEHWQCSGSTIRKLIADGRLEAFRFGKLVRIKREAVAAYEAAGQAGHPE